MWGLLIWEGLGSTFLGSEPTCLRRRLLPLFEEVRLLGHHLGVFDPTLLLTNLAFWFSLSIRLPNAKEEDQIPSFALSSVETCFGVKIEQRIEIRVILSLVFIGLA